MGDDEETPEKAKQRRTAAHYWPLLVPLAGPVWSLSYSDVRSDTVAVVWIGLIGAGQITGASLLTYGLLSSEDDQHQKTTAGSITTYPMFGPGMGGVGVTGWW